MLMPLSFVVLVSMIKDIFEDKKRHQSDNLENNKIVEEINPVTNKLEKIKWRKI